MEAAGLETLQLFYRTFRQENRRTPREEEDQGKKQNFILAILSTATPKSRALSCHEILPEAVERST